MKKFRFFFLFLMIALVVSCKKDKPDDIDLAYDYINTELGSYIVYQVDSILYDDFDNSVTKKTVFYKEKMVENFTDNLNRPAQRVERYTKDSLNTDWKLARAYYIVKTNKNVEKVEENLRFISFVFPPVLGETWAGNRFIEPIDNNKYLSNWTYRYTDVDKDLQIGDKTFKHSARVLLQDKETAIEKIYAEEIYSRGIGMVYKEWWHLETQNVSDQPWLDKAQRGFVATMKAIDYGKE